MPFFYVRYNYIFTKVYIVPATLTHSCHIGHDLVTIRWQGDLCAAVAFFIWTKIERQNRLNEISRERSRHVRFGYLAIGWKGLRQAYGQQTGLRIRDER